MALDTQTGIAEYDAPKKDLYEIGEMPPLGHVPRTDVRMGDPPRSSGRTQQGHAG